MFPMGDKVCRCSLWSEGFLGIAIYLLRGSCRTLRFIFVEVDVVAKHQNRNHRSVASFRSVQRRGGGYRLIRLVVRNDASYDESCARGAPPGGSLARGGEHTGTTPPRALGLHARLDHPSLPHFTNPCHLSAHRCWPRVEDIHLSPQLAPRVLQRFITGAFHPRQLQCGYGPQGPVVGLSVLTETSQGLTSRLADLGARRPHPRHYVAAGGDQRSSQHSDQRSGQRSDQRNSQRKPAGRRSTESPAQQLKKNIVACFDNLRGGPRAAELDVIVRENRRAMTPASAVTLMHRCAKTLKDRNGRNHVDVRPYLSMIVDVVGQPTVKLPVVHLSMALYGLQSMSSNEPEVKALLQGLAPKVKGCKEELDAQ
ncbi:hypothetical protein CYMTET_56692, partial [Cymbomonas tetramitiformis]